MGSSVRQQDSVCRVGVVVLCRGLHGDNPSQRAAIRSSCPAKVKLCATFQVHRDTARPRWHGVVVLFLSARVQPCRASNALCCRNCFALTIRVRLHIAVRVFRQE